jgi:hypothetical protein
MRKCSAKVFQKTIYFLGRNKLILCLASPARVCQNCAHFLFISLNLRIFLLFLIYSTIIIFWIRISHIRDMQLPWILQSLFSLLFKQYLAHIWCLKFRYMGGASLQEYQGSGGDRDEEILARLFVRNNMSCTSNIRLNSQISQLRWAIIPWFLFTEV